MKIRLSREGDLERIWEIYETSRVFMRENGNPNQWDKEYPSYELVQSDIGKDGYVIEDDNGRIVGVFVLEENAREEAYENIDGAWLNDEPYGVIHRGATGGSRLGAGQLMLDWCFEKCGNIRVDTHEDNVPMLSLFKKNGYHYCGKIWYEKVLERVAFQKTK